LLLILILIYRSKMLRINGKSTNVGAKYIFIVS